MDIKDVSGLRFSSGWLPGQREVVCLFLPRMHHLHNNPVMIWFAVHFTEAGSTDSLQKSRSGIRVRNRFWLAYVMTKNPSLVAYRAKPSEEAKMEECVEPEQEPNQEVIEQTIEIT
jgi:hypothetical protein